MHYLLVNAYVAQARKRVSEGDCQTIAPLHPDNVDDVIVALAARAEAAEAELAQWRDGKMSTAEDAATHLKMLNDIACLHTRAEAAEAERRAYEIFANSEITTLKAENARLREALGAIVADDEPTVSLAEQRSRWVANMDRARAVLKGDKT